MSFHSAKFGRGTGPSLVGGGSGAEGDPSLATPGTPLPSKPPQTPFTPFTPGSRRRVRTVDELIAASSTLRQQVAEVAGTRGTARPRGEARAPIAPGAIQSPPRVQPVDDISAGGAGDSPAEPGEG